MNEVKKSSTEGRELNMIPTQCHDTLNSSANIEQCQRIRSIFDARDMKIIQRRQRIEKTIQNKCDIKEMNDQMKDETREWLVNVYESSTSDAFKKYHRGQLEEGEEKSYAAKNYLTNITLLMQSIKHKNNHLSQKLFKFIDQQSKEIINQLIFKYHNLKLKHPTKN